MWLHLLHLVGTILSAFIEAIGTTLLGLALGLLFGFATAISAARRIKKDRGWDAVLVHWRENVKTALRVSLICACIVYCPDGYLCERSIKTTSV